VTTRCLLAAAAAVGLLWIVMYSIKEHDFCWVVFLGFVAGSIGPWAGSWLHKRWLCGESGKTTESAVRRHVEASGGEGDHPRAQGAPSDASCFERSCTWQPRSTERRKDLSVVRCVSMPEESLGRKASKKLIPDPDKEGKWKYVDCAPEIGEAGIDQDEELLTPRLGPPTPPMHPPSSHNLLLRTPRTRPLSQAKGLTATPHPVPLPPRGFLVPVGPCAAPAVEGVVEYEEREVPKTRTIRAEKIETQASRVSQHVRAFEAKFYSKDHTLVRHPGKDELALAHLETLRRVERKGWHMSGQVWGA